MNIKRKKNEEGQPLSPRVTRIIYDPFSDLMNIHKKLLKIVNIYKYESYKCFRCS